jgi:hypothetical protein
MAMTSRASIFYFIVLFIIVTLALFPNIDDKISNAITGREILQSQVWILDYNSGVCNITFVSGWNLVSIPCISENKGLDVLDSLYNSYYSIHAYDSADSSDPWKSYNPELPGWVVQDLSVIDRRKGYWINMQGNDTFYHEGDFVTPNLVYLYQGWNLVGYPTFIPKASEEALTSVYPNYVVVYAYNATLDEWKFYRYGYAGNTLNYTVPYYGYWINMSASDNWNILW